MVEMVQQAPPLESMPRTVRHAWALQQEPAALPTPLTQATAACVARYVPLADGATPPGNEGARFDDRQWLACTPELRPRSGGAGRPWSVSFGAPPDGLSGVERILWPELGAACARAVLFTAEYVRTRRFMAACELSGASPDTVSAWRMASPLYSLVYGAAEAAVRSGRLARCEDTLHAVANGDCKRTKQAITKEGEVVTLEESIPPDTKALALALGAEDPARYRPAPAAIAAPAVAINITYQGVGWCKPVEAEVGPAAYDADSVPAEVTDTEEELS